MAGNVASAAVDAFKAALQNRGFFATEEVAKARLETCQSCEFFKKESIRCMKCGCYMTGKVKMTASQCPAQKWKE